MGRLFGTGGWTFGTAGGDFGSASGKPCCVYQARFCSGANAGQLAPGIFVNKSQFPSYPSTYYFSSGGTCYYAQSTDKVACNSTPIVSGQTTVASCADPACAGCGCCSAIGGTSGSWLVTFSGVDVSGASCCNVGGYFNASASINGTYTLPGPCGGEYTTSVTTLAPIVALSCSDTHVWNYYILLSQVAASGGCPAGWTLTVLANGNSPYNVVMFESFLPGNGIWDTDCTQSRTFPNYSPGNCASSGSYTPVAGCTLYYSRATGTGGSAVVTPC